MQATAGEGDSSAGADPSSGLTCVVARVDVEFVVAHPRGHSHVTGDVAGQVTGEQGGTTSRGGTVAHNQLVGLTQHCRTNSECLWFATFTGELNKQRISVI